jgi:hypothetical protein
MSLPRIALVCLLVAGLGAVTALGQTGGDKKTEKKGEKKKEVWTDPSDPTLPADFQFQGEYVYASPGHTIGCQVIALGNGKFQAVVLPGGLPGQGWDGKNKSLMDGKIEGTRVLFTPAMGKRKYLAQSPLEFSATAKFPPPGQVDLTGSTNVDEKDPAKPFTGALTIQNSKERDAFGLQKTTRKSPTLGLKASEGAVVLFDGSNKDQWNGGRIDKTTGFLNTDGNDITTKRMFLNYTAHVEFFLPFRPDARGQGRGNSGFYQVDQYEVQILDSFGLEGKDNECGGVYTRLAPKVNMCLPPLQWQTYDVEFTAAVADESGKKIKNARISVKHNGVVIHDNAEIAGVTGGARQGAEGTPGVLRLQGHGNPLQFRNIWVVEKK